MAIYTAAKVQPGEELFPPIESVISELQSIRRVLTESHNTVKEVLNADEAADFLRMPKATMYKYTSGGRIPFRKIGKRLVFLRSELLQWLHQRSNENLEV